MRLPRVLGLGLALGLALESVEAHRRKLSQTVPSNRRWVGSSASSKRDREHLCVCHYNGYDMDSLRPGRMGSFYKHGLDNASGLCQCGRSWDDDRNVYYDRLK